MERSNRKSLPAIIVYSLVSVMFFGIMYLIMMSMLMAKASDSSTAASNAPTDNSEAAEDHLTTNNRPGYHTLTFYDKKGGSIISSQDIEYGGHGYPTDGFIDRFEAGCFYTGKGVFLGWEYEPTPGNPAPFTFDLPISGSHAIWGKWQDGGFQITYNLDGGLVNGADKPPIDGQFYDFDMYVRLMDTSAARSDRVFHAWQSSGGNVYSPNTYIKMSELDGLTMTAMYAPVNYLMDVRFHSNIPDGHEVATMVVYRLDETFSLLSDYFYHQDGRTLIGWSLVPDRGEDDEIFPIFYKYKTEYVLDKDKGIDFYGVWELPETTPPTESPPTESPPTEPPEPPPTQPPPTQPPTTEPPEPPPTQPPPNPPPTPPPTQPPPTPPPTQPPTNPPPTQPPTQPPTTPPPTQPPTNRPPSQPPTQPPPTPPRSLRTIPHSRTDSLTIPPTRTYLPPHVQATLPIQAEPLANTQQAAPGQPFEVVFEGRIPTIEADESAHVINGDARTWALWNLIMCIACIFLATMAGIRTVVIMKRVECDYITITEYSDDKEKKKCVRLLFLSIIPINAIAGVYLFIITQDIKLTMIMIDWWTTAYAILLAGGIFSYIFAFTREKDEEDPARIKHKLQMHRR